MSKSKKIARNTLMLYVRMLFSMFVSLYTSRIVLDVLGVEDYGIYNVVGGVVTVFYFLNSAMSGATQRFLSFELGTKNFLKLNNVFNAALTIHLVIGLVIILLGETVGVFFLNNYLNIPSERLSVATLVLHFSLAGSFLTIVQVPFNALIIANEKMDIYALISVGEVVLKLLLVFLLTYIEFDKLVLYSVLISLVQFIIVVSLISFCFSKFKESKLMIVFDKPMYKELISYSGWNLFGNLSSVAKDQGINILLNIFFGPTINAARAVSYQVSGSINSFARNFQIAVNPQIIKSYASGDKSYMMKLIFASSRLTFFLLFFLALPILIETHFVLKLWLKAVPNYAVIFTFLIIINALVDSISGPLMTAANSTGKIKWYQIIVGSTLIMNLPISYIFLKLNFNPEVTIYIGILLSIAALYLRLLMINKIMNFNIKEFYNNVVKKIFYTVPLSLISPCLVVFFLGEGFLRFFLVSLLSSFSILVTCYYFGLTVDEKKFVVDKIKIIFKKIKYNAR